MPKLITMNERIKDGVESGWVDYVERIKQFRSRTGVEIYIFDEACGYACPECYLELMPLLAELMQPTIVMADFSYKPEGTLWRFEFSINGVSEFVEIENPQSRYISLKYFQLLNQCLARHGSQRFVRSVFMQGSDLSDECIELVFISDEIYQELLQSEPAYAE